LKGNGEGAMNNIDAKILLQMFTNQGRSVVMSKLCYRVHKLKNKHGDDKT
jgi:hypothetical protein